MRNFSLTCLGVGDGWPCADRRHSSYLYRFGKTSVLIDCGEPVSGAYKATGWSYDAVDRIFLSHLHADHFGGLFMLLQGFWLERRRKNLTVHMPGAAIAPLRQMLPAGLFFEELLAFRLHFNALRAGRAVPVGNTRVTAFHTTHLAGLRARFGRKYPGYFEAFCFLLESGRLRVGHSGDISRPEDLEPLLAHPLDLLVCELAHPTAEEMFSYLSEHRIGRVVFTHLARTYWENPAQTRRLASRMLPDIPHTFARDGERISL